MNNPKILAATYNPVSNTKMFTVMIDIPYVLLPELLQFKELNVTYKKIEDIEVQEVFDNPYIPIWTKEREEKSSEIVDSYTSVGADHFWLNNLDDDSNSRSLLSEYFDILKLQIHKQNANLLLLPFANATCIISGTEWDNFWSLRCPKYESPDGKLHNSKKEYIEKTRYIYNWDDKTTENSFEKEFWQSINKSTAKSEFQIIAEAIYDLHQEADWKESKYHIPFEDEIWLKYSEDLSNIFPEDVVYNFQVYEVLMKISASMCAKLSYNTQDNEDALDTHLERANELIKNNELEVFKHQAVAMDEVEYDEYFVNIRLVYKVDETSISKIKQATLIQEKGKCYNLIGFIPQSYILKKLLI